MRGLALLSAIILSSSLCFTDGPDLPSVEQLIESLASNDFAERQRALDALSTQRSSSAKYAMALREQLHGQDQERRQQAAKSLQMLQEARQ